MTSSADLFNTLPSLEQANNKFSDPQRIFPMLVDVLTGYEDKFGINLVHRHTTLDEGEKMVTKDDTTGPMKDDECHECHPERWLVTGEPYVFNTKPTETPPKVLLDKLKAVVDIVDAVGYIDGVGVLGLGYLKNLPEAPQEEMYAEMTEGRKDIAEHVPKNQKGMIATWWKSDGTSMIVCTTCIRNPGTGHKRIDPPPQHVHDPHDGDHGPHHGGQGPSH